MKEIKFHIKSIVLALNVVSQYALIIFLGTILYGLLPKYELLTSAGLTSFYIILFLWIVGVIVRIAAFFQHGLRGFYTPIDESWLHTDNKSNEFRI